MAGLYDLTTLGRQLHREALLVGWQIALSDEAICLEKFLRTYFQGGAAVLAELKQLDPTSWSAEAQESLRREIGYFSNNVARMDYPRYLENGWRIGSGPIEAACKTVIGTRMKGTGMRWKPPATDAIASLRAAYEWHVVLSKSFRQNDIGKKVSLALDRFIHKSITGKEATRCEIVTKDGSDKRSDSSNASFFKMAIYRFPTFFPSRSLRKQ